MAYHVVSLIDDLPPGGRKVVEVNGRGIVVFNVDGEFFALLNRCPHQGAGLCGGLLTVAILAYRGSALAVYTSQNIFLKNFANPKGGIPYGIALGIGGLVTYPASPLMAWALERLGTP